MELEVVNLGTEVVTGKKVTHSSFEVHFVFKALKKIRQKKKPVNWPLLN